MKTAIAIGLFAGLAFVSPSFAADDDDKLPAAEVEKIEAVRSDLNCQGYEDVEVEANGQIEIEDAKCKWGTMDIKLDKDHKVIVISRD